MLLVHLAEKVQRAEATQVLEERFGELRAGLCGEERFASLAKCTREWMSVDRVAVFAEDVQRIFVQSGFISGGLDPV